MAWNLLQQEGCGKVVMVEARGACSGASGRNGMYSSILCCVVLSFFLYIIRAFM